MTTAAPSSALAAIQPAFTDAERTAETGRVADYEPVATDGAARAARLHVYYHPRPEAKGNLMPASVGFIVIDSVSPDELARFWCALLDVQVDGNIGEGQFIVLSATAEGLVAGFQQVPEAKSGKNRLHLDLVVEDLDASTAEIEGLGGKWLEPGRTRELEGFRWRCMADPEGNEFDIDTLPVG
jgi:predicted enzyme related to lactoylglutathione lyase